MSALPSAKRALLAFSAGAAPVSARAPDNVRRSAATASRQIVPRLQSEVEVCASTASSLSSFACAVSSCSKSGGAFHLADDRIKGAVGVLRRTEVAQARVRFAREAFHAAQQ